MGDRVALHKIDGAPPTLLRRMIAVPATPSSTPGPTPRRCGSGGDCASRASCTVRRTFERLRPGSPWRCPTDDWLESFRPPGAEIDVVPMEWFYGISFAVEGDSTVVEVLATHPVMRDRDAMISMGGEVGWNESFEKLDGLLALGRQRPWWVSVKQWFHVRPTQVRPRPRRRLAGRDGRARGYARDQRRVRPPERLRAGRGE